MRAAGKVDASSAARLAIALEIPLAAGPPRVLVDLGAVTFLDSSGWSALANGHRRATAGGIELQVSAAGRAALPALQISGLWQLLGDERDSLATATPPDHVGNRGCLMRRGHYGHECASFQPQRIMRQE